MMRMTASKLLLILGCLVSLKLTSADRDSRCQEWAHAGECENNPGYMLSSCKEACARNEEMIMEQKGRIGDHTFFDLFADDIDGNVVDFEQFRDKVTVITNVASFCGYTKSHYEGLVELWSQVKDKPVNILAFPCNQFGQQEPGSSEEIKEFAKSKGVNFTMMRKIDVNGPDTSLVYVWLKDQTDHKNIQWNFATYFVANGDGIVEAFDGVEPKQLKDKIFDLIDKEL